MAVFRVGVIVTAACLHVNVNVQDIDPPDGAPRGDRVAVCEDCEQQLGRFNLYDRDRLVERAHAAGVDWEDLVEEDITDRDY